MKNLSIALLSAVAILAPGSTLFAQSYLWSPAGSELPPGGSGLWNLTDSSWSEGLTYLPWPATNTADAIFGGTGGTVALDGLIEAGKVIFQSGGYTLSGGQLRLTGTNMPPAITVENAGDIATIYSDIRIADGAGTFVSRGPGTLNIAGALGYEQYGNLYIQGSTMRVLVATGSIDSTFSYLRFGGNNSGEEGGGTFVVDNSGATSNKTVSLTWGTLTSAGDATIRSDRNANYDIGLNLGPEYDRTTGSTLNLVVNGGTNGTQNRIQIGGLSSYINQGTFFNGSSFAWYNTGGGGYVRGINYGADSNAVTTSGGTVLPTSGQHFQITGAITAQTTKTITTLKIGGAHNFTIANSNTVTVNGILKAGGNASTIAGGSIRAASGQDLVIRTDLETDSLTINSNIVNNNGSSLVKSGAGSLALNGSNTYTGSTYLNGGLTTISTLANNNTNQALGRGTLELVGGSLRYTGTSTSSNKEINIRTGGGSFAITNAATTVELTGRIASSGSGLRSDDFIKDGPGTMIFSGAYGNSLDATVKGGTLILAKESALYTNAVGRLTVQNTATAQLAGTGDDQIGNGSEVIVESGGTLDLNGRNETIAELSGHGLVTSSVGDIYNTLSIQSQRSTDFSGTIEDGAGTVSINYVGGHHTLSGENTYTGGTSITDSTLQIGHGGTTGSIVGNVYLYNVSSLDFNRSDTYEYSGAIEGWQGTVNQIGSGTLILSGNSEFYYGETHVKNGNLRVDGYIMSTVTVEGGATLAGTGTIDNTTLVKSGARIGSTDSVGTLTFGNDLTLEGDITMSFQLGTVSDMLRLTGGILYGPSSEKITLDITAIAGFAAGTYTLIDYRNATASDFSTSDFLFGTTPEGYTYSLQITNRRLNLIVTAVPEPTTVAILIFSLCIILFTKRRSLTRFK